MNNRRNSILFILVTLACMAFTGCGAGSKPSSSSVSSSDTSSSASTAIFSASSLVFSSQVLNSTSPAKTVTLTNTGNASLSLTSVSVTGSFAETTACPSSLPAGASCTISVTFTPTATGTLTGAIWFADNAAGSPQQVALSGTGVSASSAPAAPAATVSTASLTFGSQVLNTTSPADTVTLKNTGNASLSLTSVSVTGSFAETTACPSSLPAGASCTISVTFTPTATGTLTGAIWFADNAAGSPQQVALSGTGVSASSAPAAPAATVSTASLTFGSQVLNTTSPADTVTLKNTGNASLSLTSVSVTGNFAQTNTCGTSLSAGASCTVGVTFTPTAAGAPTGTLSFADNAPPSPQVVHLYGTGANAGALAESPASLSFGAVTVGGSSSKTITITNTGGEDVIVTSVGTGGAGLELSGISTPLTLASNQSSTFTVTFHPSSSGSVSGTVSLTDNSATPSVAIPVTGTGAADTSPQVTLNWSESSSGVIGYNVYRGTVTGGPYTELTSSPVSGMSYTDSTVVAGDTYFYIVTAVGTDNMQSGYSAQIEAVVPAS